jgi:hypothetical protein
MAIIAFAVLFFLVALGVCASALDRGRARRDPPCEGTGGTDL